GRIYLTVQRSDGGGTGLGVSIPAAGPFNIRGVPNGSYTVQAFQDTQLPEAGIRHASDPAGKSAPLVVNNAGVSSGGITLAEPPVAAVNLAPPVSAQAVTGDGIAFVGWDPAYSADRVELTRYYTVYWSDTPNPGPGNFKGKSPDLPSLRNSGFLVRGLTNGGTYYLAVTARLASGATENATTNVNNGEPVIIGPRSGGFTVSGTVDTAGISKNNAPLWVAVAVPDKAPVAFTYIAAPSDL